MTLFSSPPLCHLRRVSGLVGLTLISASSLSAHPGHEGDHGGGLTWDFSGGFGHPLGGLDHVLAMLAVGIWAAQLGGRARCWLPTAFLSVLAASAALGTGVFPGLEQGIAASVLVLGLLIVSAARLPLGVGVAVTAVFAAFHGVAHGAEMPANTTGMAYGAGFLAATALLHLAGLGLGASAMRAPAWVRQTAGTALVAAGAWILSSA